MWAIPISRRKYRRKLWPKRLFLIWSALVTKDYLDARFAEQEARIDSKFSEQDARIDGRFSEQDARIDSKFAHIDVQFAEIKGQFRLVYWMLAVVIASTVIHQVNALLSN